MAQMGRASIGTLVERATRFVVLVRMPARKADVAASAFAGALNAIPESLRKTLTYDQGKEMAAHAGLAEATGMRICSSAACSLAQATMLVDHRLLFLD